MTDRIEQQASRGASQLFQAIKDVLGMMEGIEKRLAVLEQRVAEIQNGNKEPRFTMSSATSTQNTPVAG